MIPLNCVAPGAPGRTRDPGEETPSWMPPSLAGMSPVPIFPRSL